MKIKDPNYQNQVIDAWNYFDDEENDKVNQIITELLDRGEENISSDIFISCLILQSLLLMRSGNDFKKSSALARKAFELAESEQLTELVIKANSALILNLLKSGIDSELADLLSKFDEIYESEFNGKENYLDIKKLYYFTKGQYYRQFGDMHGAIENFTKSSDIAERMGNKLLDYLKCLLNISSCYDILAEVGKSQEYNFKIIDIISSTGKDSKYDGVLASTYEGLGIIYGRQGYLDKAVDYLNRSLNLFTKLKYSNDMAICLFNLAYHFFMMGETEKSTNHFIESRKNFRKNNNKLLEMTSLAALLLVYTQAKEEENKKIYFNEIELLYNENRAENLIKLLYLYSKGLFLKDSRRLTNRIQAQNIFKELISGEETFIFTINSITFYLELLVDELKQSNSESVLVEIERVNARFRKLAETDFSQFLVIQGLLIDAKISIIKLEFNKARQLLSYAQILAEQKGFRILSQDISREHDNFLTKLNQWENIVNESISIQDRIEMANIENALNNIITNSYVKTQEEKERSIILLISNSAGIAMFSRSFMVEPEMQDQLMAGLITAINSFSQETFKTNAPIERIKQGENTVILKKLGNLTICYAFNGPSYFADKKINDLITKIKMDDNLSKGLQNYVTSLSNSLLHRLNTSVDEIFV